MNDSLQKSKKVQNRINCWFFAIHRAKRALESELYFWNLLSTINNLSSIKEWEASEHYMTAMNSLQAEAIILYGQVFNQGNAGELIEKNTGDLVVEEIRENMKLYIMKELNWDQEKYKAFHKGFIMCIRNEVLGHYDGDKANYEERIPGIIHVQRSPSAALNRDQIKELSSVIRLMYNFIISEKER